jgi:hypothetical protein
MLLFGDDFKDDDFNYIDGNSAAAVAAVDDDNEDIVITLMIMISYVYTDKGND